MAFQRNLSEARGAKPLAAASWERGRLARGLGTSEKMRARHPRSHGKAARRRQQPLAIVAALLAAMGVAACSSDTLNSRDLSPGKATAAPPVASEPAPDRGAGDFKVGLILPLSASGNAGAAGQAMRNAAEMALAEVGDANIALLAKDDGGTAQGAQLAAQQAIDEGAQVILGPLFAHSVTSAKPVARSRGVPMIAFSTDSNVAAAGTYLLSFLPESDVDRVVDYATSQGKHSFIGVVPSSAYGSVVEGEFKQAVARRGGRVIALEHYGDDRSKVGDAARLVAQAAAGADALFIPDGGEAVNGVVAALSAAGVNVRQFALMGTQLWDDPKIFANPSLEGGWYPAPDPAGFRAFADRYRRRYAQDPPRPAALAYDAVTLVAALAKAQGPQRITNEALTDPSGFAGIDGVFRFRNDGTNQRGLAVLRVTPSGGQVIAPALRTFGTSALGSQSAINVPQR
ncbi:MAG TPA: penicillin-binding protein activator [Xanthobacteraceae bacterium]|jgi:ABC-type branched-subunit amino acid transport system substrate-binding protein|nr:penicillin-binding protein activator [Xanthobacteraceae bacterium]